MTSRPNLLPVCCAAEHSARVLKSFVADASLQGDPNAIQKLAMMIVQVVDLLDQHHVRRTPRSSSFRSSVQPPQSNCTGIYRTDSRTLLYPNPSSSSRVGVMRLHHSHSSLPSMREVHPASEAHHRLWDYPVASESPTHLTSTPTDSDENLLRRNTPPLTALGPADRKLPLDDFVSFTSVKSKRLPTIPHVENEQLIGSSSITLHSMSSSQFSTDGLTVGDLGLCSPALPRPPSRSSFGSSSPMLPRALRSENGPESPHTAIAPRALSPMPKKNTRRQMLQQQPTYSLVLDSKPGEAAKILQSTPSPVSTFNEFVSHHHSTDNLAFVAEGGSSEQTITVDGMNLLIDVIVDFIDDDKNPDILSVMAVDLPDPVQLLIAFAVLCYSSREDQRSLAMSCLNKVFKRQERYLTTPRVASSLVYLCTSAEPPSSGPPTPSTHTPLTHTVDFASAQVGQTGASSSGLTCAEQMALARLIQDVVSRPSGCFVLAHNGYPAVALDALTDLAFHSSRKLSRGAASRERSTCALVQSHLWTYCQLIPEMVIFLNSRALLGVKSPEPTTPILVRSILANSPSTLTISECYEYVKEMGAVVHNPKFLHTVLHVPKLMFSSSTPSIAQHCFELLCLFFSINRMTKDSCQHDCFETMVGYVHYISDVLSNVKASAPVLVSEEQNVLGYLLAAAASMRFAADAAAHSCQVTPNSSQAMIQVIESVLNVKKYVLNSAVLVQQENSTAKFMHKLAEATVDALASGFGLILSHSEHFPCSPVIASESLWDSLSELVGTFDLSVPILPCGDSIAAILMSLLPSAAGDLASCWISSSPWHFQAADEACAAFSSPVVTPIGSHVASLPVDFCVALWSQIRAYSVSENLHVIRSLVRYVRLAFSISCQNLPPGVCLDCGTAEDFSRTPFTPSSSAVDVPEKSECLVAQLYNATCSLAMPRYSVCYSLATLINILNNPDGFFSHNPCSDIRFQTACLHLFILGLECAVVSLDDDEIEGETVAVLLCRDCFSLSLLGLYGMARLFSTADNALVFTEDLWPQEISLVISSSLELAKSTPQLEIFMQCANSEPPFGGMARRSSRFPLWHFPPQCLNIVDHGVVSSIRNWLCSSLCATSNPSFDAA